MVAALQLYSHRVGTTHSHRRNPHYALCISKLRQVSIVVEGIWITVRLKCLVYDNRGWLIEQNYHDKGNKAERSRVHHARITTGEQRPLRGLDRQ